MVFTLFNFTYSWMHGVDAAIPCVSNTQLFLRQKRPGEDLPCPRPHLKLLSGMLLRLNHREQSLAAALNSQQHRFALVLVHQAFELANAVYRLTIYRDYDVAPPDAALGSP